MCKENKDRYDKLFLIAHSLTMEHIKQKDLKQFDGASLFNHYEATFDEVIRRIEAKITDCDTLGMIIHGVPFGNL